MRLFIAIGFSEENKQQLSAIATTIKRHASRSRQVEQENYHLTLAFIGESDDTEDIIDIMDTVAEKCHPFTLETAQTGRFRRPGGDVCWIGFAKNNELLIMQRMLASALREKGFDIEDRPYHPHLTLLREAVLPGDFPDSCFINSLPILSQAVSEILLIKSERIKGKLVYTSLYNVSIK